jgi:hypothetical protein
LGAKAFTPCTNWSFMDRLGLGTTLQVAPSQCNVIVRQTPGGPGW